MDSSRWRHRQCSCGAAIGTGIAPAAAARSACSLLSHAGRRIQPSVCRGLSGLLRNSDDWGLGRGDIGALAGVVVAGSVNRIQRDFLLLSLQLLAVELRPFCGSNAPEALARLRRITLIPFLAALAAAGLGGALIQRDGW